MKENDAVKAIIYAGQSASDAGGSRDLPGDCISLLCALLPVASLVIRHRRWALTLVRQEKRKRKGRSCIACDS